MKRFIIPISFLLTCSFANAGFAVTGDVVECFTACSSFSSTGYLGYKFSGGTRVSWGISYGTFDAPGFPKAGERFASSGIQIRSPDWEVGSISCGFAFGLGGIVLDSESPQPLALSRIDFRIYFSKEFMESISAHFFIGVRSCSWARVQIEFERRPDVKTILGGLVGCGVEACF